MSAYMIMNCIGFVVKLSYTNIVHEKNATSPVEMRQCRNVVVANIVFFSWACTMYISRMYAISCG